MKIVKKALVEKLATRLQCNKRLSNNIITTLFDIISEEIAQGNKVGLPGLGTLLPILHKSRRTGAIVNGKTVVIPAMLRVRLINSKGIKEQMKLLYASQIMDNVSLFQ